MQRRGVRNSRPNVVRVNLAGAPLPAPSMGEDSTLMCIILAVVLGFLILGISVGIVIVIIVSISCNQTIRCAHLECGTIDMCGFNTSCGTCVISGWTCVDHACECTYPTTCISESYECDNFTNNCGDELICGTCAVGMDCVDHICNCTSPTACDVSYECGNFTNNCGDELICGTCPQGVPCVDHLCIMNPWAVPLTTSFQLDSSADRVFPAGWFTTASLNLRNANQSVAYTLTHETGATTTGYVASYDFGGTLQWVAKYSSNASISTGVAIIQVMDADTLLVGYNAGGVGAFQFYDAGNHTVPSQLQSGANVTTRILLGVRTINVSGSWSDRFMYVDGTYNPARIASITDESNYNAFFYHGQATTTGTLYFHAVDGTVDFSYTTTAAHSVVTLKGDMAIGHWEWKAKISSTAVMYPRIFQSSEVDGSVIIGNYATTTVTIYDSTDTNVGSIALDVGDVNMIAIVKYSSNGTVDWFTKIANIQSSGYGSGTDDGIGAYFSQPSDGVYPLKMYDAGNPPTLATAVPTSYLQHLIKYSLSNGTFEWYTQATGITRSGGALPFSMLSVPNGKVLYPGYSPSSVINLFYNANGTVGINVTTSETAARELIVAYDSDGVVTWPAYGIRRASNTIRLACSTGYNVFSDVRGLTVGIPVWEIYGENTTSEIDISNSTVDGVDGTLVALRLPF